MSLLKTIIKSVLADVRSAVIAMLVGGAILILGPVGAATWKAYSREAIPWTIFIIVVCLGIGLVLIGIRLTNRLPVLTEEQLRDLQARHQRALSETASDDSSKQREHRQKIRDELSAYLVVADKLKRQCVDIDRCHTPSEGADEWYGKVATYIRENVSYADKNRFISDTNIPHVPPLDNPNWPGRSLGDPERERVWQFLNKRAYQLAKILDELKPL